MVYKYALKVGTVLNGKYKIIPVDEENDILGVGGFGITYKCLDTSTDSTIVVKEFFPSDFATREGNKVVPKSSKDADALELGLKSFIKETKILAKFRGHPNIVDIYERFDENKTSYFVMPFEKGRSLTDVIEEKTFTEKEIIALMIGILEGLKVVHAEGILHRDLKPDNIFMKENQTPMMIDFGSAKNLLSERTKLLTGVAAVSAGYAAPEQYSRKLQQGPFTDIHALGIIMYQLITKAKDKNIPTSTDRTLDVALEWPESIQLNYSAKLIAVAKRASRLIPEERYQDAMSMRHALLECSDNPPPPPPPPEPEQPELESRTVQKMALISLGVVALLGMGYLSMSHDEKIPVTVKEEKNVTTEKVESTATPKSEVKTVIVPTALPKQEVVAVVVEKVETPTEDIQAIITEEIAQEGEPLVRDIVLNPQFVNTESYQEYSNSSEKTFYLGAMLRDAHCLIKAEKKDSIKLYYLVNKIKLNSNEQVIPIQKKIETLLETDSWAEIAQEITRLDETLQEDFKKENLIALYAKGGLWEDYRLLVETVNHHYEAEQTKGLMNHPLLTINIADVPKIVSLLEQIKGVIAHTKEGILSPEQVQSLSKILEGA